LTQSAGERERTMSTDRLPRGAAVAVAFEVRDAAAEGGGDGD